MTTKRKIICFAVLIPVLGGIAFTAIRCDLNSLTSKRVSAKAETVHLDDLKDSYTELYGNLYSFDKNKVIFIRFSLINNSVYTLRDVKLAYNSDYAFERIGVPDLQDGGEVIGNPRFNTEFVVPFVISKEIDEKSFLKSLNFRFDFSVFNKLYSLTD